MRDSYWQVLKQKPILKLNGSMLTHEFMYQIFSHWWKFSSDYGEGLKQTYIEYLNFSKIWYGCIYQQCCIVWSTLNDNMA